MSVFGIFLVRIFPHLDWIWRDTKYLSVFSPNEGKNGPDNSKHGLFSFGDYFEMSCFIIIYTSYSLREHHGLFGKKVTMRPWCFSKIRCKLHSPFYVHRKKSSYTGKIWRVECYATSDCECDDAIKKKNDWCSNCKDTLHLK